MVNVYQKSIMIWDGKSNGKKEKKKKEKRKVISDEKYIN